MELTDIFKVGSCAVVFNPIINDKVYKGICITEATEPVISELVKNGYTFALREGCAYIRKENENA